MPTLEELAERYPMPDDPEAERLLQLAIDLFDVVTENPILSQDFQRTIVVYAARAWFVKKATRAHLYRNEQFMPQLYDKLRAVVTDNPWDIVQLAWQDVSSATT